jgi:hypothetical protein
MSEQRGQQRLEQRAEQRVEPRRRVITTSNRYEFDESKIPPHMAYKWVRKTLAGMEDGENMIMHDLNGWTPVPANRHPELAGRHAKADDCIVRGGLMLMEQPKEYQQEAQQLEQFAAQNQLETQIARLGQQARQEGGMRRIKRTIEPIHE